MYTKFILVVLLYFFLSQIGNQCFGQMDNVGPGYCLEFDGVDDRVDLGDIYNDLSLPVTVSAWINIEPSVTYLAPIFVSQDNPEMKYRGFWLAATPDFITVGYGDGKGGNNPAFRRSKTAYPADISGKWVHVSATIRSALDMTIYVNGIDAGGNYTGYSDYPMENNNQGVARIGKWDSNMDTYHFTGKIDELRVWNYSRNVAEIRKEMCHKLKGDESGLVGYWRFNEISATKTVDYSSNAFDGEIVNNTKHLISGAPIGDESVFNYTSDGWDGLLASFQKDNETFLVENIEANAKGIHIYKVNESPSNTNGLNTSCLEDHYYGAYIVNNENQPVHYNIQYLQDGANMEAVFSRSRNSSASWREKDLAVSDTDNGEYIVNSKTFELGEDITVCAGESVVLDATLENALHYEWSDHSTERTLTVSSPGKYWISVETNCGTVSDTIQVTYEPQPEVYLGEDIITCFQEDIILQLDSTQNYMFQWQDNSAEPFLRVSTPGKYWVTVSNSCGMVSDTITISKVKYKNLQLPNAFSPNGDKYNQVFKVDERLINSQLQVFNRWGKLIYSDDTYQNNWDGENLSAGVYFYTIYDDCTSHRFCGWIHLFR